MPSRGVPEARKAICDWYARKLRPDASIPTARRWSRWAPRKGWRTCCWRSSARATACCRPTPAIRSTASASSSRAASRCRSPTGPGRDAYAEIETALARAPRKPKGLIVNFPHNPTSAVVDLGVLREGRRAGQARVAVGDLRSRLRRPDARRRARRPASSRSTGARDVAVEFFTVSKSYSMPGWRVGFCVGNRALVGALTNIKGYLDYGMLRARRSWRRRPRSTSCDARRRREPRRLQAPRDAAVRPGWRRSAGRCRCPSASMFVWAPLPRPGRPPGRGRSSRPSCSSRRGSRCRPGVGFGPGGEGYVRFALIETDDRTRRACAAIGDFLARSGRPGPPAAAR